MNVLITGASRGIGYETAIMLAKEKVKNILLISRNTERLKVLKDKCLSVNPSTKVVCFPFNLEELNERNTDLINQIGRHVDSLDVLINNAGYLFNSEFSQFPLDEAKRIFEVNFFKPALLIRLLRPLLLKSKKAHVVNISSMGGFQGSAKFPGLSYYSASKSAIACLTECLAEEYKDTGINFNCLALGAVQTEMLAEAFPGYQAPLEAYEMAKFISNFAIEGHKFFNGKILPVALSTP